MCRSFSRRISSSDLKAAMPPPMIRVTFRSPVVPTRLRGRAVEAARAAAWQFGAPLYQLPEDDPDFLFDGAAVPGRAEPQIGFDGFVEFSDGQAGHGGLRQTMQSMLSQ